MTEQGRQPVRPESEYGEHPAGAQGQPVRGDASTASGAPSIDRRGGSDSLDAHREAVLGVLAREEELAEAQIAKEVPLEATQISSLLARLQHDGALWRPGLWENAVASLPRVLTGGSAPPGRCRSGDRGAIVAVVALHSPPVVVATEQS